MTIEQYKDLQLTRRGFEVLTSNRDYVSLLSEKGGDLDTVSGRTNMAQAIVNRLLTRRGELSKLGHPDYGSRLHELVGNSTTCACALWPSCTSAIVWPRKNASKKCATSNLNRPEETRNAIRCA